MVVEKATELGVKDFFPFISGRTIKRNSEKVSDKFFKTVISASKQCDNAIFPKVNEVNEFDNLIEKVIDSGYVPILAYENERNTLLSEVLTKESGKSVCLIIGPEGGFSETELEICKKYEIDIVSLGNHILRAETAAICGISQISAFLLAQNRNHY